MSLAQVQSSPSCGPLTPIIRKPSQSVADHFLDRLCPLDLKIVLPYLTSQTKLATASVFAMQREEIPRQEAGEAVETTEAVKAAERAAEEKQKREDRAAVTRGLTDLPTMKQLSTSGWEAKTKTKK